MTVTEELPAECPNGHPLKFPNVLIGGDCEIRTVLCRTCGMELTKRHDGLGWTSAQRGIT